VNQIAISVVLIVWGINVAHAVFESQTPSVRFKTVLSDLPIDSIGVDKYGYVWIGTIEGLIRYDGFELTPFLASAADDTTYYPGSVDAMLTDSLGNFWIGTAAGLSRFDYVTQTFERVKAAGSTFSIAEFDDHIWITHSKGIFRIPLGTTQLLDVDISIVKAPLGGLAVSRDGSVMYLLTRNGELFKIKKGSYELDKFAQLSLGNNVLRSKTWVTTDNQILVSSFEDGLV
jgi:ligand-binding sensor domain-containing protein